MLQLLRSGKVYFFAQQKRSCDLRFRRLCRNCVFWVRRIPATSCRLPGNDAKKRRQQRIYQRKCHSLSAHDSVCDTPILLFGSFVLSCYLLLTVRRFGFARHPFTSVVNLNFGHLKALAALNRDPH